MPPAFNLSQDQTLQFDLICLAQRIEVNFTSLSVIGHATMNLAVRRMQPQTPTLIGCQFLKSLPCGTRWSVSDQRSQ
jgi:hypothetical protein